METEEPECEQQKEEENSELCKEAEAELQINDSKERYKQEGDSIGC